MKNRLFLTKRTRIRQSECCNYTDQENYVLQLHGSGNVSVATTRIRQITCCNYTDQANYALQLHGSGKMRVATTRIRQCECCYYTDQAKCVLQLHESCTVVSCLVFWNDVQITQGSKFAMQ
jgi:hypothetical protein